MAPHTPAAASEKQIAYRADLVERYQRTRPPGWSVPTTRQANRNDLKADVLRYLLVTALPTPKSAQAASAQIDLLTSPTLPLQAVARLYETYYPKRLAAVQTVIEPMGIVLFARALETPEDGWVAQWQTWRGLVQDALTAHGL